MAASSEDQITFQLIKAIEAIDGGVRFVVVARPALFAALNGAGQEAVFVWPESCTQYAGTAEQRRWALRLNIVRPTRLAQRTATFSEYRNVLNDMRDIHAALITAINLQPAGSGGVVEKVVRDDIEYAAHPGGQNGDLLIGLTAIDVYFRAP